MTRRKIWHNNWSRSQDTESQKYMETPGTNYTRKATCVCIYVFVFMYIYIYLYDNQHKWHVQPQSLTLCWESLDTLTLCWGWESLETTILMQDTEEENFPQRRLMMQKCKNKFFFIVWSQIFFWGRSQSSIIIIIAFVCVMICDINECEDRGFAMRGVRPKASTMCSTDHCLKCNVM